MMVTMRVTLFVVMTIMVMFMAMPMLVQVVLWLMLVIVAHKSKIQDCIGANNVQTDYSFESVLDLKAATSA